MAMLKMQRVYVYALLKYCKDILEALQRRGVTAPLQELDDTQEKEANAYIVKRFVK